MPPNGIRRCRGATAVIWEMLLVAEQRFRRLDAPEKMEHLFAGGELQDELEAWREEVLAVASPFYTPIDGTS